MATIAPFSGVTFESGSAVSNTYNAINGAGGDGSVALWRLAGTTPVFTLPSVTMMARANKARNARHLEIRGIVPWARQSIDTGIHTLVSRATFFTTIVLPDNAPNWVHKDIVHLAASSIAAGNGTGLSTTGTQLVQIQSGYAPG